MVVKLMYGQVTCHIQPNPNNGINEPKLNHDIVYDSVKRKGFLSI